MSIVRDLSVTLRAMADQVFVTCSAILSTAGSTSPVNKFSATADAVVAPTGGTYVTFNGNVIDRIGPPLGTLYMVAQPSVTLFSTRGSTEANRQIGLGLKMQHGDSSGGGDMADYATQAQPDDRTYFGTGRTTDMLNWDATLSTGVLNATSNPAYYDLRAAKRYIRVVGRVMKNGVTTETSGDELSRIGASITFIGGQQMPEPANTRTSPFSTSTSTV